MFIKCVTIPKKYIFLILFPIFKIVGVVLEKKLLLEKVNNLYSNLFIISFLTSLGNILCVTLWIFRIILNLRKNGTLNEKSSIEEPIIKDIEIRNRDKKRGLSQVEIFIEEIIKKNKMKLLKEIFILFNLGFIFLFATILKLIFIYYYNYSKNNNNDNLVVLLFTSCIMRFLIMLILSLFFLNDPDKIYKHQKFSLVFIVALSIINIFIVINYTMKSFFQFTILIFSDILYSLFYIGGKAYIIITYKSPFKMMFFVGIICFILTCILYIIFINNESIIVEWINNLLDNNIENVNKDKIINISVYFNELQNNSFLLIPKLIIIFLIIYISCRNIVPK